MEKKASKLKLPLKLITVLLLVCCCSMLEAQIVSHELRRLAVATNQFGIDVLKALDRIEPPDKVLVFCPVCLSSSLVMIMMGSSKYQVVSSLRHALYVWSMNPHDINRGFKDIFEHIGLNQWQQTLSTHHSSMPSSAKARYNLVEESLDTPQEYTFDSDIGGKRGRMPKSGYLDDSVEMSPSSHEEYLSLPKLIRMRECLEKSNNERPWWTSASIKSNNGATIRRLSLNSTNSNGQKATFKYSTSASNQNQTTQLENDAGDVSQMSALCNIYIQRGLNMNYNYNLLLRQYYKTVIHPVDFVRNGEETRQHINSLVAANTEGKIRDLIKRRTADVASKIMIVSTFHFRGTLDIQINTADTLNISRSTKQSKRNSISGDSTTPLRRQRSTKNSIFIETEETLLKYGLFKNLECSVIEIPFNNRLVSLVIVMPNHHNSTELLLTKLSAQVLSDMISSLAVKKISIDIPVIKFDRGPVNVEGLLKELGLDNLFYGDKVYTSETGFNRWMKPSDIVHETSIDIGTINPKWGQTEDRLTIAAHNGADSTDSINRLVLTMGRIRQ